MLFKVLGFILVLILIDILLIPGPRSNLGMTLPDPQPAGSPQFIQGLAGLVNTPIEQGEPVTVIPEGEEFLPDLLAAINSASSSIDFTTYPWANGTMSSQVLGALAAAAQRGVAVRVLIDALGGNTISNADIAPLTDAGAQVERYHSFSILNPLQYDSRDHMRSIVIDGKIGFTGGMGIGDDWLGDGVKSGWSDIMFEVKDQMAESLQDAFAAVWNETTGEIIEGPSFYPVLPSPASAPNTFVHVISIPGQNNIESIRDTFLYSILNAQNSIYIISPFIIPDPDVVAALENKARSGVDVEILSPGAETNAPLLRDAWRSDYDGLLAAGVKIYEYNPQMIHTKIMVIDSAWSVIGSANMDSRSEVLNAENIMGIEDPDLAAQLQTIFAQDITNSTQITQAAWAQKSSIVKLFYDSIKLFTKQL
jgi:cardiolipin synthase